MVAQEHRAPDQAGPERAQAGWICRAMVGKVQRLRPVEPRDAAFLRRHIRPAIKFTPPGPFTRTQLAKDEHDGDARARDGVRRGGQPGGRLQA